MRGPYAYPPMGGYNVFTGPGGAGTAGGSVPATYYATILADNPDHYWLLDETSGTTLGDEIGSTTLNLFGTYSLGISSLVGDDGTAVDFLGTGNASGTAIPVTLPYTLEGIIRIQNGVDIGDMLGTNQIATAYAGISIGYTSANGGTCTAIIGDGGGLGSSNRKSFTTTDTISVNTIHHLAAVFTSFSDIKIYLDGVAMAGALSGTASTIHNTGGVTMMARRRAGTDLLLNARLDHVATYSYALTEAQCLAHTAAAGL